MVYETIIRSSSGGFGMYQPEGNELETEYETIEEWTTAVEADGTEITDVTDEIDGRVYDDPGCDRYVRVNGSISGLREE